MPAHRSQHAGATRQRAQAAAVVSRVRWLGVALGVAMAFLTLDPAPVLGWVGVFGGAAAMAAYNLPMTFVARLEERLAGRLIAFSLAADFAICWAWTVLTSNDQFSTTYIVFGLVGIEAAVLYLRRGTLAFIGCLIPAYAALYLWRSQVYGYAPSTGSVVFRLGVVVLIAVFVEGIAEQSEHRRGQAERTARRQAELREVVSRQAQRYESLLEAISDVGECLVVTERGRFVYANPAYIELTGYTEAELRAFSSLIELAPEEDRAELTARLRERLAGGDAPVRYQSSLVTKDGRRVDVETALRRLPAEGEGVIIAVVRDISERKGVETRLQEGERRARLAARLDALTGIPNRRAWDEEMARAATRGRRGDLPLTVALLDLDGFKEYNDDWGHIMGDRLLQTFATSWRDALRERDILCRYGGDEFAMLLPGTSIEEAAGVVDRLRETMPTHHTFSAGLATWDEVEAPDALMARADAALYDTKRGGSGRISVSAGADGPVTTTGWAHRIPELLARREVTAVFQPICDLSDRRVMGYEALARPVGMGPTQSVDGLFAAASRLGLSRDVDWLCRRTALDEAGALPEGTLLFVNVGIRALLDPLHDVDQMLLLVRWGGRRPSDVVLEISERDPVRDVNRLREVLATYRTAGFRFAVDDVGEGHSTLEVLANARPEYVKVAATLTAGATDRGPRAVVMGLVTYCRENGSELIAEGLESARHISLMRELGVALGQGYALARPGLLPGSDGRRRRRPITAA